MTTDAVGVIDLGSGLRGRCATSVSGLPQEKLRKLTQGLPFWGTPDWWDALPRMHNQQILFLWVEDGFGEMLAVLPCQIAKSAETTVYYNVAETLVSESNFGSLEHLTLLERAQLEACRQTVALRDDLYPALVGSISNSWCALTISSDQSDQQISRCIQAVADLFDIVADRLGCGARAIFYVNERLACMLNSTMSSLDYTSGEIGYEAVLDIEGTSFEDYLRRLSRHSRAVVRGEKRRFGESGLSLTVVRGNQALTPEILELQAAVRAKYGLSTDPETLRVRHDAIRGAFDDELLVFSANRDGKPVAFSLFFVHGEAIYSYFTGADYEQTSGTFAYFNLVYYAPIEWATANGFKKVYLSLSAYKAKLIRGFRLEPVHGFLNVKGPAQQDAASIFSLLAISEQRARAPGHQEKALAG